MQGSKPQVSKYLRINPLSVNVSPQYKNFLKDSRTGNFWLLESWNFQLWKTWNHNSPSLLPLPRDPLEIQWLVWNVANVPKSIENSHANKAKWNKLTWFLVEKSAKNTQQMIKTCKKSWKIKHEIISNFSSRFAQKFSF